MIPIGMPKTCPFCNAPMRAIRADGLEAEYGCKNRFIVGHPKHRGWQSDVCAAAERKVQKYHQP